MDDDREAANKEKGKSSLFFSTKIQLDLQNSFNWVSNDFQLNLQKTFTTAHVLQQNRPKMKHGFYLKRLIKEK